MEWLTQYVQPNYAVLALVLYCLGRVFRAIRRFPNQFIPLTLTLCGVLLGCLRALSCTDAACNLAAALFDGVVQGVLCTGMAVYVNEFISHCGPSGCSCKHGKSDRK